MRLQPAIPTRGAKVPSLPDWIHESSMMASARSFRDDNRVRLFTRNGDDWTDRHP